MTPEEIRKFGEEMLEACRKVQADGIKVGPQVVFDKDKGLVRGFASCCPLGAIVKYRNIQLYWKGEPLGSSYVMRPASVICSSYLGITESEGRGFIQGLENTEEMETDGDILFYQLGRRFRKLALNNWEG